MIPCAFCGVKFKPKARRLKRCSRGCGIAYKRTPEYRERLRLITARDWETNPRRAEAAIRAADACRSPENRQRCSEENRRRFADPSYRAKVGATNAAVQGDDAHRTAASQRMTANWYDPEWRASTIRLMRGVKKGEGSPRQLLKVFIDGGLSLAQIAEELALPVERVEQTARRRGWWPRVIVETGER